MRLPVRARAAFQKPDAWEPAGQPAGRPVRWRHRLAAGAAASSPPAAAPAATSPASACTSDPTRRITAPDNSQESRVEDRGLELLVGSPLDSLARRSAAKTARAWI